MATAMPVDVADAPATAPPVEKPALVEPRQEIILPSEYNADQMAKGTRYACAPPPEQCIQPKTYEPCTMAGKEARPPTTYPLPKIVGRKPHVVLMHGTACNEAVLSVQLRELVKEWGEVDLSYVDGSMVITQALHPMLRVINQAFGVQPMNKQYVETSPIDRNAKIYGQFGFALAKFDEKVAKLGKPVDALVGFSQGALMATLLAARNLHRADAPPPYRCVVLLNPPNPESLSVRAADYFDAPIATPAFVCKGALDEEVPGGPEAYKDLYASCEYAEHPGAHQPMPPEQADARVLANQIKAFVKQHC